MTNIWCPLTWLDRGLTRNAVSAVETVEVVITAVTMAGLLATALQMNIPRQRPLIA